MSANKYGVKRNEARDEEKDTSSHSPLRSGDLGGQDLLRRGPAAAFSSWNDALMERLEKINVTSEQGEGVSGERKPLRKAVACICIGGFVCAAFMFGVLLGTQTNAIATHAVLHAGDSVLTKGMDHSPETLAYVLNAVDVGELD
jgi:hypothetical protein